MRITNIRRGRIFRTTGLCAILLLFIYAIHSYSRSNGNVDSYEKLIVNEPLSKYKFHKDIYPTLQTGKCKNELFIIYTIKSEVLLFGLVRSPVCVLFNLIL